MLHFRSIESPYSQRSRSERNKTPLPPNTHHTPSIFRHRLFTVLVCIYIYIIYVPVRSSFFPPLWFICTLIFIQDIYTHTCCLKIILVFVFVSNPSVCLVLYLHNTEKEKLDALYPARAIISRLHGLFASSFPSLFSVSFWLIDSPQDGSVLIRLPRAPDKTVGIMDSHVAIFFRPIPGTHYLQITRLKTNGFTRSFAKNYWTNTGKPTG